jgi:RNA-directed DNA polymerase
LKRYGFLYEKIWDLDNLKLAHKNAKHNKRNAQQVKWVNEHPECLIELQKQLQDKTFKTSKYHKFQIVDNGKEREICSLPYYPDRILHWAILQVIEPIFLKTFIHDTFAAIPKKGTHYALTRVFKSLQNITKTQYCLKFDIKKYFPNIDHAILIELLERKFKDPDLLWLLKEIIGSVDNGIPIGNYLSQYFGNFYLSFFDHYCKEELGLNYFRYMDDICVFSNSKEELRNIFETLEKYLKENLGLTIKSNWQIFPSNIRAIDFLGYKIRQSHVGLRKKIYKSIVQKTKPEYSEKQFNSMMSYNGWLTWANCYNLMNKYIMPIRRQYELRSQA